VTTEKKEVFPGGETVGHTGSSDSLTMVQLQTLRADRQQAEALSKIVLAAQQHERFRLEYNLLSPTRAVS
jgi:hypothetical protein